MPYIICEKRKGNPKVNVEVCQRKCKFMEQCKAYQNYLKASELQEPSVESHAPAVSPDQGPGKQVRAA